MPHDLSTTPPAWQLALQAYHEWLKRNALPVRSAAFAGFGTLHLALAEILWEQREDMLAQGDRIVHLSSAAGLVAVYSQAQRIVQIRTLSTALGQMADADELSLRIMPTSASLLEGAVAQAFSPVPLAALMWHYGQSAVQALDHIPALQQQMLHVRRFPALEPEALHLRHLRLIHILSRENLNFEQLLPLLPEDERLLICPDLTSLFLTGTLRLKSTG